VTRQRRVLSVAVQGRPIPNELATKDFSPVPAWVDGWLEATHRCKAYPPNHPRHHIGVWELLVRRLPVTAQAKAVAAVLAEHWPTIQPSINRIRDLSGFSRGTVNNAIYVLEHAGLLELRSESGRRTRYVPLYPNFPVSAEEVAEAMRSRRKPPERGHEVAGLNEEPGHSVAGFSETPGHEVADQVTTVWPTPGHDMADPRPPCGREVLNEAPNEVGERSPAGPAAARAALRGARGAGGIA
jgi:hypothetical protein